MRRKVRWAVALAVVLLAVSGCLHGGGSDAENVRSSSLEAMESVETYAFDTETDLEVKAGERGIEDSLSITHFVRGTASESSRRMKTSSNLVVNEETIDQETYSRAPSSNTEGLTTYVRLRNGEEENGEQGGTGAWLEMDDDVVPSTPVETHARLLGVSEVEYEGEESLDGEPAHVLSVGTDTDEFEEFAVGSARELMYRVGVFDEGMFDDTEVENGSLRYWISDETDHVIRAEATANLTTGLRGAEEDLVITVEKKTEFSSYGGEVETEAPNGIENAEEFDGTHFLDGSSASSSESVTERGSEASGSDSGVVDSLEVRISERGENRTAIAKVITNPVSADRVSAEAVESGDTASTEAPNTSDVLELDINPDGDEVVVEVTRENGTEVVYNRTVP